MVRPRLLALAVACAFTLVARAENPREALWDAVRGGDVKAVAAALDKGADVNARNEIGVSAIWIAASKGKIDVVELLVRRGADVNARDLIWYQTPLSTAAGGLNTDLVKFLIKSGAKDTDDALVSAASAGRTATVRVVLEGAKPAQDVLDAALAVARSDEIRDALKKAGAVAMKPATAQQRESWKPLAGSFEHENGGQMTVELGELGLGIKRLGALHPLVPTGAADTFKPAGSSSTTYTFERKGDKAYRVISRRFTSELSYYNVADKPVPKPATVVADADSGAAIQPMDWPSFRGPFATGVADGQHPPLSWDVKAGTNVRWKTPIPGLGHSCPIVSGDRVFLTTAISGDPKASLRIGNYGDVASVNDTTKHTWQVLCLDRDSGKILWTRTVFEGVPKIKRHLKGSQANCTAATDGKRVVTCFGSEGLFCHDFTGKLLWKRDLGTLDSSFKIEREYEWGFGASPIVHDGLAILQCDVGHDSFIAAYRLDDGERVWSTPRDEIPSWSTPTIWKNSKGVELVTNAAQYARGYDPATGKELWRLAKKSEVTIPTPVPGRDLIFVTSGNRPIQPIIAIRPGANGDISLKENETQNDHVAWARMRGGPYMPTPILYGDYLYTCGNGGMITCYEAATGKEIYKERLGGVSYTASPVAADGKLYFASEQGQVRVVKAGPKFELLAMNDMGDVVMATPAISGGMLFVRGQHFLFALGRPGAAK